LNKEEINTVMDKEQARFILRSFRPDGADVSDPDFAEALKFAMENRELGEWLAHERAFDAAFASALTSIDLPENLRTDIIACLAAERGDFPPTEDFQDAAWIVALASVQPPASLREEVLAAMSRTVANEKATTPLSIFRRLAIPLAAAAGIALAFLVTRPTAPTTVASNAAVPIEVVKASFVKTYESPSFDLEEKREDPRMLVQHLKERELPCPGCLPQGLRDVKGIGCRELEIDGKRGSLICFKVGKSGIVHIVIFRCEDVIGDFPQNTGPTFDREGDWASARWRDDRNVFIMMSNTQGDKLPELF
jgi:hypothetical protein